MGKGENRMPRFTAIIEREDKGYVALCPEPHIAGQGETVEEARNNLSETLELFFEVADPSEIKNRLLDRQRRQSKLS
jgi:predicted RNase H-like HicB family nuclease